MCLNWRENWILLKLSGKTSIHNFLLSVTAYFKLSCALLAHLKSYNSLKPPLLRHHTKTSIFYFLPPAAAKSPDEYWPKNHLEISNEKYSQMEKDGRTMLLNEALNEFQISSLCYVGFNNNKNYPSRHEWLCLITGLQPATLHWDYKCLIEHKISGRLCLWLQSKRNPTKSTVVFSFTLSTRPCLFSYCFSQTGVGTTWSSRSPSDPNYSMTL